MTIALPGLPGTSQILDTRSGFSTNRKKLASAVYIIFAQTGIQARTQDFAVGGGARFFRNKKFNEI